MAVLEKFRRLRFSISFLTLYLHSPELIYCSRFRAFAPTAPSAWNYIILGPYMASSLGLSCHVFPQKSLPCSPQSKLTLVTYPNLTTMRFSFILFKAYIIIIYKLHTSFINHHLSFINRTLIIYKLSFINHTLIIYILLHTLTKTVS